MLDGQGFTVSQPVPAQPEIESARYGADGAAGPMSPPKWPAAIHDHGTVTANNDRWAAIRHQGSSKQLEIKYRLNGKERNQSIAENETWSIGGGASPHRFTLTPDAGNRGH